MKVPNLSSVIHWTITMVLNVCPCNLLVDMESMVCMKLEGGEIKFLHISYIFKNQLKIGLNICRNLLPANIPLVLLGDQPLTTDAWIDTYTSLLYIYIYIYMHMHSHLYVKYNIVMILYCR